MKIAIDITRAIIERAGIGRYSREIAINLLKIDQENQYFLLSTYFRDSAEKEARLKAFQDQKTTIVRAHIPGGLKEKLWGSNLPVHDFLYKKADLLFAPSFFEAKMSLKIPQVVTIHDMATFLLPDQRGPKVSQAHNQRVEKVCAKASRLIAISENTKNDLIKILKTEKEKIQVIYPGKTVFPEGGKLPEGIKAKKYILFVGTIEPRKNLINLLKAYSLLPEALKNEYLLVIVGGKGWNNETELSEIGQTKGVKWLGFVSDMDLGEIYRQATIFAYPSLYEGFGLPIIEAQQFGVPVLTSNISSLPEAVGDGGLQVDPHDTKAISRGLQRLLEDKELREDLSQKAEIHAQNFSWEKAAQETLNLLNEVNHV